MPLFSISIVNSKLSADVLSGIIVIHMKEICLERLHKILSINGVCEVNGFRSSLIVHETAA